MATRVRAAEAEPAATPKRASIKMDDSHLMREFETLLVIDKHALDDQLEQHPDLLYRISEFLTERMALRDAAKLDIGEAEAKADASIRADASIADEKVTADQVKAAIKLDRGVIAAVNRHADLAYWVARWSNLKDGYSARQSTMRELVNLYANNYWADASGGRASVAKKSKAGDIARDAMAAERLRRREEKQ